MSRVDVLFFAADPLSADGYQRRLQLDEEVRQIREKVRAAHHRDEMRFDTRWATRTDDLLQALNESEADIVHFSGHGGSEGLVLVSADGQRPHHVSAVALNRLFQVFRGRIRLVILNACTSLPQAQAIADAVGCAVGTPAKISDTAAIVFGASFYRAIAFGQSVQAAFEQACAALMLEHFDEGEHPVMVTRDDVDASRLVFISPEKPPVT
jgi:CHAT domain-containing protein